MLYTDKRKGRVTGWTMVMVASALVLLFSYLPMIQAFLLSFQTGKGVNLTFGGLANYARLLKDSVFWTSIGNTLLYAVFQIPIMLGLALLIAVLLNDPKMRLRGIYRTCIFLPCVTSYVSYAILFRSLFSADGVINNLLVKIGVLESPIAFILHPTWAKVVIIIGLVWRWTGYFMIFFLSALQNIDKSIYEAAKIDGCTFMQSLRKITMPLLKPIIFLTSTMALMNTFQLFDEVKNLTNGGPGNATRTISQYIYDVSFVNVPSYGFAAAMSYVVLLVTVIITLVQRKATGDRDG